MNCFLISGNNKLRENYISQCISSHTLLPYNIIRFDEKIKIADIRRISVLVSQKMPPNQKRLIILSSEITHDAQHALLKTVEELPESILLIISCTQLSDILPTLVSRCQIVQFQQMDVSSKYDGMIEMLLADTSTQSVFTYSDQWNSISDEDLMLLLSSARKHLFHLVQSSKSSQHIHFLFYFLSSLTQQISFLKKNNVNRQFYYETLILKLNEAI